jgi:hypothetical protein
MSSCAVPGHACLRVGPLGAGTLVARWPSRGHDEICCHGWQALTGALSVADSRTSTRLLATADVIVAVDEAGSANLGDWLRRYPGCAVAVSTAKPGECSVATRDGVLYPMTVSGPQAVGPLACAAFAYGWLAAGRSLELLRPAHLHLSHDADDTPGRDGRLFFKFSYCPASGDGPEGSGSPARLDSARRT